MFNAQMNAAEMTRQALRLWTLWGEANLVIAMRLWGMAGLWNMAPGEVNAMVAEKAKAFGDAAQAGAFAAFTGKSPERIGAAALAPVLRKARSNRRRLAKAGPKLGL